MFGTVCSVLRATKSYVEGCHTFRGTLILHLGSMSRVTDRLRPPSVLNSFTKSPVTPREPRPGGLGSVETKYNPTFESEARQFGKSQLNSNVPLDGS